MTAAANGTGTPARDQSPPPADPTTKAVRRDIRESSTQRSTPSSPEHSGSSPTLPSTTTSNGDKEMTPLTKSLGWLLGYDYPDQPLYKRLNYIHCTLLLSTPLISLYGLLTTPVLFKTFVWTVVYYYITGLGITAGYHRYFSHRAYEASMPVKIALLLMGAGAFEGSCRWWSRGHRAHHRYVDTPKDPYSFKNGFWYAHIGWMLARTDKSKLGYADIEDLLEDKWVTWQHNNYLPLALFMAFVLPTLVAGLGWGDFRGGYFLAGVARLVFVHHSTFCVNSLAHYTGANTYSDQHTAKNSFITALCTVGEGYHNFHHEFPSDYRNGVMWYQYDPTKVFIRVLSWFGLTYNLKRFPQNEIVKGSYQMEMKQLQQKMDKLNWGPNDNAVPEYTVEQVEEEVRLRGRQWIILDGFVVDTGSFVGDHPGGEKIIKAFLGKDATKAFYGETYKHSIAAKNLQRTLRVGRVASFSSKAVQVKKEA